MIVADFDVERIAIDEAEADPPLIVDGYGMLALPITSERVEPVPRGCLQVTQPGGEVHILDLADCPTSHIRWESPRRSLHEQLGRSLVREGLDHGQE